jgi:hypothetical protein
VMDARRAHNTINSWRSTNEVFEIEIVISGRNRP